MKVKFTKLAALLLAGAALFGCSTDYEVDIQKVDKKVDDLISGKVATLENQVAGLQATIATLESAADHAKDIKDVNDKIDATKDALQAQIDKINNETIPAINQKIADLQSGKLDKATFDEYKTATAETIRLMQEAIQNLADTKLDKTVFDQKVAEIIAKFDDYVLTSTFEEFKKIAATKQDLADLKEEIEDRLATDEENIDKLQKAMTVVEGKIADLEKTAEKYTKIVDDIVAELAFAEGDLQGYIDDAAAKALEDAMAYTDAQIDALREEIEEMKNDLLGYIYDLYNTLFTALRRIESINYVPTHDDLKIGINVNVMSADVLDEETGETKTVGTFVGQPTKVTYKITPTELADEVAEYCQMLLDPEDPTLSGNEEDKYLSMIYWQLYEIFYGYGVQVPAFWFDVKPLQTRAEGDEEVTPQLLITNVVEWNERGEVTFEVLPLGIASPEFLANALKPVDGMFFHPFDDRYGAAFTFWDEEEMDGIYVDSSWDTSFATAFQVYELNDLYAYQFRQPFAASLNFYMPVGSDNYLNELYFYWEEGYLEKEPDIYAEDYFMFENEVASPYNVLYPINKNVQILGEPYKPTYDEDGNPVVDDEGYAVLTPAMEEHQELPYSSLRENPVGEKASQDPKGYRIILNESVPAVIVEDDAPMTFEDAAKKYGIILPDYEIAFKEFTYSNEDNAKEPLYIGTEKVYAEVEMNPAKSAAERKLAIGDVITGTYTYSTEFGDFEGWGDVTITPALGEVAIDATIVWTYAEDADVDHNLFYETGEDPQIYSREQYAINVSEEDAEYLKTNLDIDLDSFKKAVPTSFVLSYVDKETGETVEVEYDPVTGKPVDEEAVAPTIDGVTITDEGLFANITDFEWDQVYTIVAVYELDDATITVNGTITTIDRNREPVVIGPYEHTFIVNDPEEYYDGYYHWTSESVEGDIFKAFDEESVINLELNEEGDFEYDAEKAEFAVAELEGKLKAAAERGTAWGYIDIKNATGSDVYAWTMKTVTPEVLAGDIFSSGERSEEDPNLWLGNTVTRNITTYIGEEVQFSFIFNYKVPDYNFLHLRYYTFNKDKEVEGLITMRDFADNDGSVLWWTQVNPSYYTDPAPSQLDVDARVSNRYALADYDVAYINLAELAFNVVDDKDEIIEDADLEELGLAANFIYTDETQGEKELTEVDQIDPDFLLYESLWVDNTVFYYRTNEKKFIPALGQLTLTVGDPEEGGYAFPVATRFEFPKAAVKFPEEVLDYSTYAMVRWTPFKAPQTKNIEIVLDENKIYREPLFKGMTLMDNRPNGVSFYVIKDGEWVVGDAAETATGSSKSNGYLKGIDAKTAYHIETEFVYDTTGIPSELKKLLTIEEVEGVPYVVYDYTSEVQFHGVVTIPVAVVLETPWQEEIKFAYNFIIRGYGE